MQHTIMLRQARNKHEALEECHRCWMTPLPDFGHQHSRQATDHALRQHGRKGVIQAERLCRVRVAAVVVQEPLPHVLQEGVREPPPQRLQS